MWSVSLASQTRQPQAPVSSSYTATPPQLPSMSPTPASSLHGYSRQFPRSRRPRNANPYDTAHTTRPVIRPTPPPQAPITSAEPTLDEGDDEEDDTQEMDDADIEGDEEEVADAADITEEIEDGNGDGEGAIEEGG